MLLVAGAAYKDHAERQVAPILMVRRIKKAAFFHD
jgi:hypothetical protein